MRILLSLALLFWPVNFQEVQGGYNKGAGGGTTWSIAHSGLVSNNQASGVARSLGWTTTAASTTIEVACILYTPISTNSISGITDNATGGSSTWQTAGSGATGSDSTTNVKSEIWYSYIKSGATTMTVATTPNTSINMWSYVYEVNGIATSNPVDVVGNVTTGVGSGTNNAGASITTTVSGDFIMGCNAPDAGSITGVSGSYTADSTSTGIGFTHFTATNATAAAHQVTYTNSSSGDHYETSDASFKHN